MSAGMAPILSFFYDLAAVDEVKRVTAAAALIGALRDAQALEMVEETDNGWQTKVVPDALAQKAAKEIVDLRQQVNELRNQLAKVKS